MSSLKGKKVLITGGASGIGLLMGKMALIKGAAELCIWDINPDAMHEVSEALREEGFRVISSKVDVSKPESVAEASRALIATDWIPDILILNAGVVSGKFFHEHAANEILRTIGVNISGVMLVAHAFLPEMVKRGSGHMVTIASAAGMLSNPRMAVYAGSKWAVLGWSESVRLEMEQLRTGVKVTTVTPSYIDTGMFDGVSTNFVIPRIKPEVAAAKIIRGIERNKVFVRMPFMVYTLPFVKGIMPVRWFDFLVGKGLGVYKTMSTFTGRK
ncbi:MAG: SDR family NAD(P)-dependent oxidoreductase [Bacteroidia bacterium]|jgi:short-subunit dehydrogenase|nr:SDR family NAD(P)-dependent oxidoreductase [Bacteroidia bacterium]